jgi:hypothetical protein
MAAGLLWFSVAAIADVCPKKGEIIQTTAYTNSFQCAVGTVLVEGAENPKNIKAVGVTFRQQKNRFGSSEMVWPPSYYLPFVPCLLATTHLFNIRHGPRLTSLATDLQQFTSIFSGGGNCDQCEKSIEYDFDWWQRGDLACEERQGEQAEECPRKVVRRMSTSTQLRLRHLNACVAARVVTTRVLGRSVESGRGAVHGTTKINPSKISLKNSAQIGGI